MRLIPITMYDDKTMQLATPVYDGKGRTLIAAQNVIHPKYIDRLKQMGITHLIIEDVISKGITLDEMLDMPVWLDVIQHVQEVYHSVANKKPLPLRKLLTSVGKLISEVKFRKVLVSVPSTLIAKELSPYAHAVNVTLVSLQIGKKLGYTDLQLRDLALGALLHDIGKAVTREVSKHPEEGFQILRKISEISLLSAHVAFQHHETMDGEGYPRKIAGNEVLEMAQICAIANIYDNLISKEQLLPHEALEKLMTLSDTKYSEKIVRAFINSVATYPPGTKIRLQNEKLAIVTEIKSHLQRPVVRLLDTEAEVSLADDLTMVITGTC